MTTTRTEENWLHNRSLLAALLCGGLYLLPTAVMAATSYADIGEAHSAFS
ncbi:MAG: hypothetical protein GY954_06265, partial [Alteromonas sp.]|nr:hypothetical protein [Alteromonas sp.]